MKSFGNMAAVSPGSPVMARAVASPLYFFIVHFPPNAQIDLQVDSDTDCWPGQGAQWEKLQPTLDSEHEYVGLEKWRMDEIDIKWPSETALG